MNDNAVSASREAPSFRRKHGLGRFGRMWKKVRHPLAGSSLTKYFLATLIAWLLCFIRGTNRVAAGSDDAKNATARRGAGDRHAVAWPASAGTGAFPARQPPCGHVLAQRGCRTEFPGDREIRIRRGARFGAGGPGANNAIKGGARALIALKKSLDAGSNVAMIADIPHGEPREAGLGIVTLARISGRPILPVAIATSRRKVLEKSWDKTTINLPFGRRSLAIGTLIHVPSNAGSVMVEEKRREVTAQLNAVTGRAYQLVDGVR